MKDSYEEVLTDAAARARNYLQTTGNKIDIDTKVLPDTVDQRIDWACAISQRLEPGYEFAFSVFDPITQY